MLLSLELANKDSDSYPDEVLKNVDFIVQQKFTTFYLTRSRGIKAVKSGRAN